MEQAMLTPQVKAQIAVQNAVEHMKSDRGEIGSWLILAAALAIAAGLVAAGLSTWIAEKGEAITSQ